MFNQPLQQTKYWEKLQNDLNEKSFFIDNDDYSILAIVKNTPLGNYLYLPYGPYVKNMDAIDKCYKEVKELGKKANSIYIKVEPQEKEHLETLNRIKAKKAHPISPELTWILDLSDEKEVLIHNFTQGTRTGYNQYAKKGLTVEVTKNPDDIKYLVELQNKLAKERGLFTFSEDYYKKELSQDFASLYLCHFEDKIIAACLFFDYMGTRFYMQSASDFDYKRLPSSVAILTTAIFDAKDAGFKYFDFWGIAPIDADNSHPWFGFTKFKKSFGGFEREYLGTYDIVLNPLKYSLYHTLRNLRRKFRRVK